MDTIAYELSEAHVVVPHKYLSRTLKLVVFNVWGYYQLSIIQSVSQWNKYNGNANTTNNNNTNIDIDTNTNINTTTNTTTKDNENSGAGDGDDDGNDDDVVGDEDGW